MPVLIASLLAFLLGAAAMSATGIHGAALLQGSTWALHLMGGALATYAVVRAVLAGLHGDVDRVALHLLLAALALIEPGAGTAIAVAVALAVELVTIRMRPVGPPLASLPSAAAPTASTV